MKDKLSWFQPPVFPDKEKTLIAGYIQKILLTLMAIGFLAGLIDSISDNPSTLFRVIYGIILLLVAHALNQRGYSKAASYIILITMLVILTLELVTDQGIHDRAIILYPVIIMIASLLLQRNGVVLITLAVLLSVTIVVFGETNGIFPNIRENLVSQATRPVDALVVGLIIVIGSVITSLLSRMMLESLNQSRRHEDALAKANRHLTQQAALLESSEMRWRSLVETAPNTILSVSRDGTITFHNKSRYQDRVVGKKVFDFLSAGQEEYVQRLIDKVFETGERSFYEGIVKFDVDRWYLLAIGPVKSEDGQVTSLTVVASDIDDYRRALEELNTSQMLLKQRADQLSALNQVGRQVSELFDLKTTLNNIMDQIRDALPLDVFYVALYDPQKDEVSFPILFDSGHLWDEPSTALNPETWVARVVNSRQPMLINRSLQDIEKTNASSLIGDRQKRSASILISPMIVGDKIIGAVSAQSYSLNAYSEDHLSLLTGIAYQTAIAIENARLYEALQKELVERRLVENEIRQLNAELEERVAQRTAELQTMNQELEAFTYSISHDLRAPLRAIKGYAQILSEELQDELSEDTVLYLNRIHEGVERMGHLIDDLLLFSRTARQPIIVKTLTSEELTRIVNEVAALIQATNPSHQVDWRIAELPGCRADPNLLRQVFMNLVDNAFKYSCNREQAVIEVSGEERDDYKVYLVRDNGIGFDMQYAETVFGVFQRLHLPEEYEGTGVGLAIAQRIVQRHGGKVWVEAESNMGATFYFSIKCDLPYE